MRPLDRYAKHRAAPADGTGAMTNWRTKAACLNGDPELFFLVGTAGQACAETAAAQQI